MLSAPISARFLLKVGIDLKYLSHFAAALTANWHLLVQGLKQAHTAWVNRQNKNAATPPARSFKRK